MPLHGSSLHVPFGDEAGGTSLVNVVTAELSEAAAWYTDSVETERGGALPNEQHVYSFPGFEPGAVGWGADPAERRRRLLAHEESRVLRRSYAAARVEVDEVDRALVQEATTPA